MAPRKVGNGKAGGDGGGVAMTTVATATAGVITRICCQLALSPQPTHSARKANAYCGNCDLTVLKGRPPSAIQSSQSGVPQQSA